MSDAWFKSWFDSPYYHLLYQDRNTDEARDFVRAIFDFLKPPSDANVLDLCCGKGRHSQEIHQLGYTVTGADLSPSNIARAQEWCKNTNGIQFVQQDMRDPLPSETYDIVVNLFTSFGYFPDDATEIRVLENVRKSLRRDGTFVLDFLNLIFTLNHMNPKEEKNIDNILFRISRKQEDGFIIKTIDIIDGELEFQFKEQVKCISLDRFESYFKAAGLKLIHTFGNYSLEPFNPETSPRLILVAERSL